MANRCDHLLSSVLLLSLLFLCVHCSAFSPRVAQLSTQVNSASDAQSKSSDHVHQTWNFHTTDSTVLPASISGAVYVGCFVDSSGSVLPNAGNGVTSNSGFTAETCSQLAIAKKATYFGLEDGGECFWGNALASSLASTQCTLPCGASTERCGGIAAIDVWNLQPLVLYNNGNNSVLTAPVRLVQIFYGSWSAGEQKLLTYFHENLNSTTWWQNLMTYYDSTGAHVSNQFQAISYFSPYVVLSNINSTHIENIVTDAVLNTELSAAANSLYFVYSSVASNDNDYSYCTDYCGNNGLLDIPSVGIAVRFGFIGNPQALSCSACAGPLSYEIPPHGDNNLWGADAAASISAHHIANAITDQVFEGWTSSLGAEEIGDVCDLTFGPQGINALGGSFNLGVAGSYYLVQQIPVLATQQCGGVDGVTPAASSITCNPGAYMSPGTNALFPCIPCVAGTYQPNVGATSSSACIACPVGTYSQAGAGQCSLCPAGSYNNQQLRSSCTVCPNGYTSSAGSTTCVPCPGLNGVNGICQPLFIDPLPCPDPFPTCVTSSGVVEGYCLNPRNLHMYSTYCLPTDPLCTNVSEAAYDSQAQSLLGTALFLRGAVDSQCAHWQDGNLVACPTPTQTCFTAAGPKVGYCWDPKTDTMVSTFCNSTLDDCPGSPPVSGHNPPISGPGGVSLWFRKNGGDAALCSNGYASTACPTPQSCSSSGTECYYLNVIYSTYCSPPYDNQCYGTTSGGSKTTVNGVPIWFRSEINNNIPSESCTIQATNYDLQPAVLACPGAACSNCPAYTSASAFNDVCNGLDSLVSHENANVILSSALTTSDLRANIALTDPIYDYVGEVGVPGGFEGRVMSFENGAETCNRLMIGTVSSVVPPWPVFRSSNYLSVNIGEFDINYQIRNNPFIFNVFAAGDYVVSMVGNGCGASGRRVSTTIRVRGITADFTGTCPLAPVYDSDTDFFGYVDASGTPCRFSVRNIVNPLPDTVNLGILKTFIQTEQFVYLASGARRTVAFAQNVLDAPLQPPVYNTMFPSATVATGGTGALFFSQAPGISVAPCWIQNGQRSDIIRHEFREKGVAYLMMQSTHSRTGSMIGQWVPAVTPLEWDVQGGLDWKDNAWTIDTAYTRVTRPPSRRAEGITMPRWANTADRLQVAEVSATSGCYEEIHH